MVNNKENYFYTQGYYPYYYSSGYGTDYPYQAFGYKGPGSYQYPGYGPAFSQQKASMCKLGCLGDYEYSGQKSENKVKRLDNCLKSCTNSNPY